MRLRLRAALAVAVLLWLPPGLAQQTRALTPVEAPPEPPILRIEAEFHTQVVNGFARDADARIVATASDDKTIRIWQASDGAPLATIRVPIAGGDEGALYAVAISPDGKTLLAGGSTGFAWDRAFAVYIFDVEGQRLRGRLPNLPGPINHLAFSPDGGSIALAMGNGGGVWLVDARNGSLVNSDQSYTQRATWVEFDRSGRLYATGFDGEVRVYDPGGRRLAHRTPVQGAHPYAVSVSPDGRTVAVGYADQPRVELLNAQDLSPRASLAANPAGGRETRPGGLGAVAWGEDGSLFAAGSLRGSDGRTLVRHWGPGASGRPADWPGLRDTVFQVGALPDGGVLLVGADPALVRLDRTGRTVFRKEGPGLDFRDMGDRLFRVSEDGLSVQLQTKAMPAPWLVDLGQRSIGPRPGTRALTPVAAPAFATIAPGPRVEVTAWRNSTTPRIGGQPVRLAPEERSRSYAQTPSGELALLGTDYQLRAFRRDGVQLDAADLPGAVWAVGVSGDGRTAVAAVGDGTLRWFGLGPDGRLTPRVALFAAADARRWVAWTPSGFFDYSDTGGESLVGVLLNHARNQMPEWFSFAQVYGRFYAPDTVAARLRGQDVPDPAAGIGDVRQTLAKAPPPGIDLAAVCWAASPGRECRAIAATSTSRSMADPAGSATDATVPADVASVSVQYRLRGEGGATSAVDLFVNGHNGGRTLRQVAAAPGANAFEQPVALEAGLNRLQLRAYDRELQTYAQSRPLQVVREPPPQPKPAKPNLYILAVGINDYAPAINRLSFAVADARSVAAAIKAHVPGSYGATSITELYDGAANTQAVLAALASIGAKATADDTVLIYLSGHGTMIGQQYYFVTQNVGSVADVPAAGLSELALIRALAGIRSSNAMMFLDTCHAGAFSLDAASKIAHETGRYVLAAAASVEEALDSYDDRNGVFATAVLRGLAGKAAAGKDVVNNFDLGLYVTPLVRALATERHHNQSARFKIDADDARPFPIVDVLAEATH